MLRIVKQHVFNRIWFTLTKLLQVSEFLIVYPGRIQWGTPRVQWFIDWFIDCFSRLLHPPRCCFFTYVYLSPHIYSLKGPKSPLNPKCGVEKHSRNTFIYIMNDIFLSVTSFAAFLHYTPLIQLMQGTSSTGKSLGLYQQHRLLSSLIHESDHQFRSTLLPSRLWTKTRRVALYPHRGCHIISLPHHIKCIKLQIWKSLHFDILEYDFPHKFPTDSLNFKKQQLTADHRTFQHLSTLLATNSLNDPRSWRQCVAEQCRGAAAVGVTTECLRRSSCGQAQQSTTWQAAKNRLDVWIQKMKNRERLCDLRTETPVTLVHEKTWIFNISVQGDFWVTSFICEATSQQLFGFARAVLAVALVIGLSPFTKIFVQSTGGEPSQGGQMPGVVEKGR